MTNPANPTPPIGEDILCLRCQYNLRTLSPAAICPECALPVQTSIHFHHANPLLAKGATRLAIGTTILTYSHAMTLLARLFSLIMPMLFARPLVIAIYNPVITFARVTTACALVVAVLFCAASHLAPKSLRWGGIHALLLAASLAIVLLLVFIVSALLLIESPGGIAISLDWFRARYAAYFLMALFAFPVDIYGYIFIRSVVGRPAFAAVARYLLPLFILTLVFDCASVTLSALYLAALPMTLFHYTPIIMTVSQVIQWGAVPLDGLFILFWFRMAAISRNIAAGQKAST